MKWEKYKLMSYLISESGRKLWITWSKATRGIQNFYAFSFIRQFILQSEENIRKHNNKCWVKQYTYFHDKVLHLQLCQWKQYCSSVVLLVHH